MIRTIEESLITPDRLLASKDMAKLGCHDCEGCSDCCRGLAVAVTLDPFDVRLLKEGLNYSFEGLAEHGLITFQAVDGIVLPVLPVRKGTRPDDPEDMEECVFLNEEGRCSIHAFRPGICRMFPLARLWKEDGSFSYFIQEGECSRSSGVKIRISKWLGYPDIRGYEQSVREYHDALLELRMQLKDTISLEEQAALQKRFLLCWFR